MARRRRSAPANTPHPRDQAAMAAERVERIREFVVLANQILRNPAVMAGVQTEMKYQAAEPPAEPGTGTWSFVGPNPYLVRALLLDVRNVTGSSALELRRVLRALEVEVAGDAELVETSRRIRSMVTSIDQEGMTEQNGRRLRPDAIVALWLNAVYHHRELDKLRQLRTLQPIERMVHQEEFYGWLRAMCTEAVFRARRLIDEAVRRGFLASAGIPPWRPSPQLPPSENVALRALMALVAGKGGTVTLTREDIAQAAEPYGGLERVQMRLDVEGDREIDRMTLTVSRGGRDPGPQDRQA